MVLLIGGGGVLLGLGAGFGHRRLGSISRSLGVFGLCVVMGAWIVMAVLLIFGEVYG